MPRWHALILDNFDDRIIDTFAELSQRGRLLPYLDIPLQHGSTRVLELMRRNVTREQQQELCEKMRERIPGMAIRTTFITGFPGETDRDHDELVEFVESFGFDMLGVFRYSREAGTPAARLDEDEAMHVPDEVKAEREQELMLTQQRIAFENAAYVAEEQSRFDVLIDSARPEADPACDSFESTGRCYHQAPQVDSLTYVHSTTPLAPGELIRCTVVDADGYDLIAQPTEELERKVSLNVVE